MKKVIKMISILLCSFSVIAFVACANPSGGDKTPSKETEKTETPNNDNPGHSGTDISKPDDPNHVYTDDELTAMVNGLKTLQSSIVARSHDIEDLTGVENGGTGDDPFKGKTYYMNGQEKIQIVFGNDGILKMYKIDHNNQQQNQEPKWYQNREYKYKWDSNFIYIQNTKWIGFLDENKEGEKVKTADQIYQDLLTNTEFKESFKEQCKSQGYSDEQFEKVYEIACLQISGELKYKQSSYAKFSYKNENGNIKLISQCPDIKNIKDLYAYADVGYFTPNTEVDDWRYTNSFKFCSECNIKASDNNNQNLRLTMTDIDMENSTDTTVTMHIMKEVIDNGGIHWEYTGEDKVVNYIITGTGNDTVIKLNDTFDFNYVPTEFTLSDNPEVIIQ